MKKFKTYVKDEFIGSRPYYYLGGVVVGIAIARNYYRPLMEAEVAAASVNALNTFINQSEAAGFSIYMLDAAQNAKYLAAIQ